jgi:hypothetical protein
LKLNRNEEKLFLKEAIQLGPQNERYKYLRRFTEISVQSLTCSCKTNFSRVSRSC